MIISSQHHSFDISLATKYGVEEAILIHHFLHWIRLNRYANRNIREGRCWTYQSRKDIKAHFPYWNYDRVKYLCEKLVALGVLVTASFNKSVIDKTLWYAFADEKAFGVDEESSKNLYEGQKCPSKGKSAQPIPDTKTTDTLLPPNPQTWGHPPISPKGEQKSAPPSEKRDRVKEKKEEKASFVFLTPAQHESLLKRLQGDELMLKMCYQKLSDWKISKGARGGNDYLTIIKWVIGAVEKDVQEAKTTVPNPVEDNWQKNQMLVQELKTAFPDEAGGLHFYYKDRILKDKNDRTFDVIGYLDHKDFIKVLEKHLRIQITE